MSSIVAVVPVESWWREGCKRLGYVKHDSCGLGSCFREGLGGG
jgi:hypothetical protein